MSLRLHEHPLYVTANVGGAALPAVGVLRRRRGSVQVNPIDVHDETHQTLDGIGEESDEEVGGQDTAYGAGAAGRAAILDEAVVRHVRNEGRDRNEEEDQEEGHGAPQNTPTVVLSERLLYFHRREEEYNDGTREEEQRRAVLHGRPTLVEETTERSELGDVNEPRAVAVGAILGAEGDGLVVYVDGRRYQGVAKDDEDHEGERDEGDDGEGSLEVRYVELAEQDGPDLKVGVVLLAITVVVAIQAGQHDV